jgi:hypothetical protein
VGGGRCWLLSCFCSLPSCCWHLLPSSCRAFSCALVQTWQVAGQLAVACRRGLMVVAGQHSSQGT